MIEFVAGLALAVVAPRAWRVLRPNQRDPRLTARLDQVRAMPMTPEEVRAAADRIRLHQEKWPA